MTFLIESTGARVSCLLNPEALEARRSAGVVRRRGAGGALLGNPRTDDPLVATGGGITEYDLKLLFDIDVANEGRPIAPAVPPQAAPAEPEVDGAPPVTPEPEPAPPPVIDVRSLTQPLWSLAETGNAVDGTVAPQRVRFIWGKSWNVPGVVLAVAERLERFDANGVPQRSWLSLRLRRVEEGSSTSIPPRSPTTPQFETGSGGPDSENLDQETITIPVDPDGFALDRLDQVAAHYYGDPALGRMIAEFNDLDDLLRFQEGDRLRMPRRGALAQSA